MQLIFGIPVKFDRFPEKYSSIKNQTSVIDNESTLSKRNLPTEGILIGRRDFSNEGILLGKREFEIEGTLFGRRDYPNEGILLGKRELSPLALKLMGHGQDKN